MNAWNTAAQLAEKHSNQGGIFVRLTNNHDKVVGAFCGEPFSREVVWTGERYETYNEFKHADSRPSLRVMLNFYVPDEDQMKVIEGGTAWLKDLLKVREKYGLEKWLFEIERHGEARDPKTRYTILPDAQIESAMAADMRRCELPIIAAVNGLAVGGGAMLALAADFRIVSTEGSLHFPFPNRKSPWQNLPEYVVKELSERLRRLRREDVQTFLKEFGIQRVRDLGPDLEPQARALLADLELDQPSQEQSVVDPFA